jgi:hypothetical protein
MVDGWGGRSFEDNIFKQPITLKRWAVLFLGILNSGYLMLDTRYWI